MKPFRLLYSLLIAALITLIIWADAWTIRRDRENDRTLPPFDLSTRHASRFNWRTGR